MRITMFDYGAGNLHSLGKALAVCGDDVVADTDPVRCLDTDVLVLPGVGAFAHAAARLAPGREAMREAMRAGLPTIGICLGMQLFFEASDEGSGSGLGVLAGRVTRLNAKRIPQIGWNSLEDGGDSLLQAAPLETVYYANSYVARPRDDTAVIAWTTHETDRFPAVVRVHRAIGIQFHPEKSSAPGVRFLAAALSQCTR